MNYFGLTQFEKMDFPLYNTLKVNLPSKDLTVLQKVDLLNKIKELDMDAQGLIYCLILCYSEEFEPANQDDHVGATKIDELEQPKNEPELMSFLDEGKRPHLCQISRINFDSNTTYKCFWDRNEIPRDVCPISCPIKFVPSKITKSYFSELSREKYTISENITSSKAEYMKAKKDDRFSLTPRGYYECEGIFCSFNCCIAYIEDNRKNQYYKQSQELLLSMYKELNNSTQDASIIAAPHWLLLKEHGGHLTIEQFRSSFNRIVYNSYGKTHFKPVGYLYEENYRL